MNHEMLWTVTTGWFMAAVTMLLAMLSGRFSGDMLVTAGQFVGSARMLEAEIVSIAVGVSLMATLSAAVIMYCRYLMKKRT